jgi:hypothetical protein
MKNILPLDRFLRLLLAIVLFEAAYFWLSGTPQILAYGVGAVMLLTGSSRICPMYKVMGVGASDAACSVQQSLSNQKNVLGRLQCHESFL